MLSKEQLNRYKTDIVSFAEEQFCIPETKRAIILEEHQKKILRDCFTADTSGKFPFETVLYSCPKKSGKTTIAALVALWFALTQEVPNELLITANDLEQSVARVFKSIVRAIELNPYLRTATKRTAKEILFTATGTTITALPSDYASAAGSNHGLVTFDELWAYTSENSRRLWDELTPVPTRKNSLRFIATYAGFENESQLLWELYQRSMKGKRLHADLPCWTNDGLFCYWDNEARMPWQTEKYYASQRKDLRPNAFLRLHENRWVTGEESFIDLQWFDACTDPEHRPCLTGDTYLAVGVDAAIKRDSAAVVATYFDFAQCKVVLAKHRIWQPTKEQPLDLEETLEAYLLDLYANYPLTVVRYDPFQFHRSATTLKGAGLPMEEYPQTTSNLTAMGQNLFELIKHKNIILYEDEDLRKAAGQAVAIESTRGWRIAKEKTSHKIDVIVALAMSALAAVPEDYTGPVVDYQMEPETEEELERLAAWGMGDHLSDGKF